MLTLLGAHRNMQPGTPAPQDSPALTRAPLHATTTFAGRSVATIDGHAAARIAGLPADGATAFWPVACAGAIASDATPMSERRLQILNPREAEPLATVAPGWSQPTPKRTGEYLSQNERSAKAPRMENVMPFPPDITIDMAESSNDKLYEDLTEPVLEVTQEFLIAAGIDIGEDSSDNSRQAAWPSAPRIAEQPADGATVFRPFADAWAIASDATPMSERRLHIPNDWADAPPTSVAPDWSLPTPKRTSEHLSQNERSAKATRMGGVMPFPPASRIEMAESSNDKLERTTTVGPIPDDLNLLDTSAIMNMLTEVGGDFGGVLGKNCWEDSCENFRLAAGPSASLIAEQPDDGATGPVLEISQQLINSLDAEIKNALIKAEIDIGEDSSDNSRLAAGPSASPIAEQPADGTIDQFPIITQDILSLLDAPTSSGEDCREEFGENYLLAAGPSADIQGFDADNPVTTSGEALPSRSITNDELMDLALHAAFTDAKMNGKDWVHTHLKDVSPASLDRFVHAQTGILDKKNLHQRLVDDNMLTAPSARQAKLLLGYVKEHSDAIKDYPLFCIGIGLNHNQTISRVTRFGEPGRGWHALMATLEAKELQPPDPGYTKLHARLGCASLIQSLPQDPLQAQAAIASVRQAAPANPPSAPLAPAATLPARERLAAPDGNREIEAGGHPCKALDDELMALARMRAFSDKNLNCLPWIRQHTNYEVSSFSGFLTKTGQLRCTELINYLQARRRLRSPTAHDLFDLSSFLQTYGPAQNLELLSAGVELNGNSVKALVKRSGELTGAAQNRVNKFHEELRSGARGRVDQLLDELRRTLVRSGGVGSDIELSNGSI